MEREINPYPNSFLNIPMQNKKSVNSRYYYKWGAVADAIILDYEDAVGESVKLARILSLKKSVQHYAGCNKNISVKIDPRPSFLAAQLTLINEIPTPVTVLIPKVDTKEFVLSIRSKLNSLHKIAIVIETPQGVKHIDEILQSVNISYLIFGVLDFSAQCGVRPNAKNIRPLIGSLMISARIFDIPIYGYVADFSKVRGASCKDILIRNLKASKEFGFWGAFAIHPTQLQCIHQIFHLDERSHLKLLENLKKIECDDPIKIINDCMVGPPSARAALEKLRKFRKNK